LGFSSIQTIISFLTIIPGSKSQSNDLNSVANAMHYFPLAGVLIGAIVGGFAYLISLYLQPFIVGFLVTTMFALITGLHHTDALADFADGLMKRGEKITKRNVMRDPALGSAGVTAIVLYVVGMIITLSSFHHGIKLFSSIVAAEVIAKFVMVMLAHRGNSAWEGFSSPFTSAMKDKRKIIIATIMSIAVIWFSGTSYFGLMALGVSMAFAALIQYLSNQAFGGISGDVMGASNEITRLCSLMVLSEVML
jgi:adenosylcobinamide-GDP ribazoletransferase